MTIDLASGGYALSLFGAEEGDELAFSPATGGVSGGGSDNTIAGALMADGPENATENGGEAYVILSR